MDILKLGWERVKSTHVFCNEAATEITLAGLKQLFHFFNKMNILLESIQSCTISIEFAEGEQRDDNSGK